MIVKFQVVSCYSGLDLVLTVIIGCFLSWYVIVYAERGVKLRILSIKVMIIVMWSDGVTEWYFVLCGEKRAEDWSLWDAKEGLRYRCDFRLWWLLGRIGDGGYGWCNSSTQYFKIFVGTTSSLHCLFTASFRSPVISSTDWGKKRETGGGGGEMDFVPLVFMVPSLIYFRFDSDNFVIETFIILPSYSPSFACDGQEDEGYAPVLSNVVSHKNSLHLFISLFLSLWCIIHYEWQA